MKDKVKITKSKKKEIISMAVAVSLLIVGYVWTLFQLKDLVG